MRNRKPINSTVRTRLLELITERNLEHARAGKRLITLSDVARETDISYTALSMFANNKAKTMAFDSMARLVDYFNLKSFDKLFTHIKEQPEGVNDYAAEC